MNESKLRLADGARVELGALLAKAGEGSVYEVVGRPDSVIKIFHPALGDLAAKVDKVAAMAATPPPGAVQSDGFAVLTWPQQLVLKDDRPVGYLMARADTATAVEIHSLSNPSNRANPLPGSPQWTTDADWAHLVNAAANLCLAVQVVHRVDAVIGDFQERNILVSDTTRVTLVDCDSMQFTDKNGRQFLCGVARPEFTAPEVAVLNLRTQAREQPSDYFALAVHIHLLLMAGNHPFMRGMWNGLGEQPSALELAKSGDWAGGLNSRLQPHPLAPPPTFLPATIQALFSRAFGDGVTDPNLRPSAEQWREALLAIIFTRCTGGSAHQIPKGCAQCPWCDIDNERQKRRRAAAEIPDQVVYAVPKRVVPQPKITKSAPKSASTPSVTSTDSAVRIARAKRLSGGVSSGAGLPSAHARRSQTFWRSLWARDVAALVAVLGVIIAVAVGTSVLIVTKSRHAEQELHRLDDPSGVAVDNNGTVYVADTGHNRVLALKAASHSPTVLPLSGLRDPRGLAINSARTLYVADSGNSRVVEVPSGDTEGFQVDFSGLQRPAGVAVDRQDTIYVADSGAQQVISKETGAHNQTVLAFGDLSSPQGVAVGGDGTIYVADSGHDRVLALAPGASAPSMMGFSGIKDPVDVTVDAMNTVYVADRGNNRVVSLAANASQQQVLGITSSRRPGGLAVDAGGTVFVTDDGDNTVVSVPAGGGAPTIRRFTTD